MESSTLPAHYRSGVTYSFRQELGDGWTPRFGPLSAAEFAAPLGAFVR